MPQKLSELQLKELFRNRKFDPALKAVSGKKVEILQTGEPNSDTGPDFRHSLVKINGVTMRGDIELHRINSDWYNHNHHRDRNYNSVVLHVVNECDDARTCLTQAGRVIETVELSKFLAHDSERFLRSLDPDEKIVPLRCAADNYKLTIPEKIETLKYMGEKRFVHKVGRFEERLRDIIDENRPVVFEAKQKYFRDFADLKIEHRKYDPAELRTEDYWSQLLYEGILEGLGYSKNVVPFRKLARNASLDFLRDHSNADRLTVEGILFGAANLIPKEGGDFDDESREYCAELDRAWNGVKKMYKREFNDKSEWLFFKLRPQNFPTIRIAGAAWLVNKWLLKKSAGELIGKAAGKGDRGFVEEWRRILVVPAGGYWTRHFIFGPPSGTEVRMLIGAGRAEEILINTILPLTFLRGRIFGESSLCDQSKRIYADHPPVADNTITLTIKESLFGGDNVLATVAAQQGALHLYHNFCSLRRCERCRIGKSLSGKQRAA